MRRYLLILFFVTVSIAMGCSENVLKGEADKDTKEADTMRLELALNNRDYDYIVIKLSGYSYEALTLRELYLLQMAYMGKAGFDMLGNIDKFYDNNNPANILITMQADVGNLNTADLSQKLDYYKKTIDIDQNSFSKDKDIITASGVASAMSVILDSANILINLTSSANISFDPKSPDYIANKTSTLTEGDIENYINSNNLLANFEKNVEIVTSAIDTIIPVGTDKGKIKEKLDDFLKDMKDNSGNFTSASLAKFIKNSIGSGEIL